uniref:GP57.1 n=1 Tax=Caviid herpesvirus 2 str. CIDMTR TaxID=1415526 RepID=U6HC32_9BETA|nr:GP57.1 [Caviid herpesvirus 2 str. CIDMTR]
MNGRDRGAPWRRPAAGAPSGAAGRAPSPASPAWGINWPVRMQAIRYVSVVAPIPAPCNRYGRIGPMAHDPASAIPILAIRFHHAPHPRAVQRIRPYPRNGARPDRIAPMCFDTLRASVPYLAHCFDACRIGPMSGDTAASALCIWILYIRVCRVGAMHLICDVSFLWRTTR